ncbi:unnamed protein product [Bathycoccus prasinos]
MVCNVCASKEWLAYRNDLLVKALKQSSSMCPGHVDARYFHKMAETQFEGWGKYHSSTIEIDPKLTTCLSMKLCELPKVNSPHFAGRAYKSSMGQCKEGNVDLLSTEAMGNNLAVDLTLSNEEPEDFRGQDFSEYSGNSGWNFTIPVSYLATFLAGFCFGMTAKWLSTFIDSNSMQERKITVRRPEL